MTTTPTSSPELPDLDHKVLVNKIADLFRIGSQARNESTILTNVLNTIRREQCLQAVERTFFMVPGQPDDGYPGETPDDECLLNWGHNPAQYVEQFRTSLARRAKPEGEALAGRLVSVDVSTSEEDGCNRIFAELTGETGSDGTTLLAFEKSRNFDQPEGEAPQAEQMVRVFPDEVVSTASEVAWCICLPDGRAELSNLFTDFVEANEYLHERAIDGCTLRGLRLASTVQPAAQQAAAPGALDADEMTRLRRLMRVIGWDHERDESDRIVRGTLFAVLGRAAEKLEQAAPSAPGTPEAPAWRAVTGPGQVEVGARLRFKIGDKHFHERAKLILHAGTDKEEVIYDKGRNFYFITSCVMSGFSNHKNVEFMPPKRAAQLDGGQGEGK